VAACARSCGGSQHAGRLDCLVHQPAATLVLATALRMIPLTWLFTAAAALQTAPYDFFEKYYEKQSNGPKLYVRRVFISDDVSELLPK